MTETFQCPNCRASLDYDADSRALTVRCDYCNSTVIVPEALRHTGRNDWEVTQGGQAAKLAEVARLVRAGDKIEAIKLVRQTFDVGLKEAKAMVDALERNEVIRLGETTVRLDEGDGEETVQSTAAAGRKIGCILLAILAVSVLGVLIPLFGGGLAIFGVFSAERGQETAEDLAQRVEAVTSGIQVTPAASPTPGFASQVMSFGGEEGSGPGFFDDTRQIGVDGEGRIYTGDYDGGRIQVFDAAGNFVNLWHLGSDSYMSSLAVDRSGVVYVIERGVIQRYEGVSGEPLGPLPFSDRTNFEAVATAADGSLVALARDRLVRFDSQGNVTLNVIDPFAQFSDFMLIHDDVAVDGAGNIFVLSSESVYRFDADGNFIDRIGSKGDAEDQFETSPLALAVDGRGRIYVVDFDGIKIFEGNGRYLDTIEFRGAAFAIVFNDQNELLVMDRNGNRVLKYVLNR